MVDSRTIGKMARPSHGAKGRARRAYVPEAAERGRITGVAHPKNTIAAESFLCAILTYQPKNNATTQQAANQQTPATTAINTKPAAQTVW
jgi:hypothetical protein